MSAYVSGLRDLANEILDQYFPNREGIRVRVDQSDFTCVDFIMYMSDDDYLADVLVYGKHAEDVEEEIKERINHFVMVKRIGLIRMENTRVFGGSNLIYAC